MVSLLCQILLFASYCAFVHNPHTLIGKDLLVTIGNPEIIVPLCCIHRDWSYTTYVLEEVCSEERAVEKAVEEALRARGHQLRKVGWGAALLYHDADLPFKKDANNKTDIPNLFTKYRGIEHYT